MSDISTTAMDSGVFQSAFHMIPSDEYGGMDCAGIIKGCLWSILSTARLLGEAYFFSIGTFINHLPMPRNKKKIESKFENEFT